MASSSNTINLCMIINRKYIDYFLVTLNSLLKNSKSLIVLYLVNSNLTDDDIKSIKQSILMPIEICDIKVDGEKFATAPILSKTFSKEGYYKLLLPYILPKEIKKILYLDSDIIVTSDLMELFSTDISDYLYAAVPDSNINNNMKEYKISMGFKENELYFNTGVLLVNINELRKKDMLKDYSTYISQKGDTFKFHDQQVINYFHHRNIKAIDRKYNYTTQYNGVVDFVNYLLNYSKPVIIHYAGMKPWYSYYLGKYYCEFWKYGNSLIGVKGDWIGHRGFYIVKKLISIYNKIRRVYVSIFSSSV